MARVGDACALAILVVMLVFAPTVRADEPAMRVVLSAPQGTPLTTGTVDALRIQLGAGVSLVLGPTLAGSHEEQVVQAIRLLEHHGAALVVWVERRNDGDLVFHAVDRERGHWSSRIAAPPSASEAEVERLVAVKISEIVEVEGPVATAPERRASTSSLRAVFELGAFGALASGSVGSQAGLTLAGGAAWRHRWVRAEGLFGFGVATGLAAQNQAGRVEIDEVSGSLGLRAHWMVRRLAAGTYAELGVRGHRARGLGSTGRSGSSRAFTPVLELGLEGRWQLADFIELRLGAGAQVALAPTAFLLDGETVADMGRARGIARIAVLFAVP